MTAYNAFYGQSGGVTPVINASAAGVIQTARQHSDKIKNVYVGEDGIVGALTENLIDSSLESDADIEALKHTPSGAFGSCRYKLKSLEEHKVEYERLIEVFKAHDIRYFFYNGGGDSQDTAHKISQLSETMGYPITCVGIPKTIDNDLPFTDCSAAAGLASDERGLGPDIILFPEIDFDEKAFLAEVDATVKRKGFCCVVVSEGVKRPDGVFLSDSGVRDAFGHAQLGGVAPVVTNLVKDSLGHKCHWAVCDYLQRAARHLSPVTDVEQAYALGKAAVELAVNGENAVMPTVVRTSDSPYKWEIGKADLADVANVEEMMPADYISDNGFFITDACRTYLQPLIEGEAYPPYKNGLPCYITLKKQKVAKLTGTEFEIRS